jgi:photosystem II stability/assembly factor-like uncharacterized protein
VYRAITHCKDRLVKSRDLSGRLLALTVCCAAVFSIPLHAAWQGTGPFGGDAEFIRVSPAKPGFLVVATRNAMLYESRNGGASWEYLYFPGRLAGVVHTLQLNPRESDTWYLGLEDSSIPSKSGLYRTTDGGESWQLLEGLAGKPVWSLTLWSADPHRMAAGTADGVYLSDNGGESWRRISPEDDKELRPVVSLAFDPGDSKILYAGTTHLPWRTVDGGATWESIHEGMHDDSDVFSIMVDANRPTVVLASACSGVYRSLSSGKAWSHLATPLGAFRVYLVTMDPRRADVIFAATSSGLLRSADRGTIWKKVTTSVVRSVAFDPADADRVYAAALTAGILISTDGGSTFHEASSGFADHNISSLTGTGNVLYASSVYEGEGGGVFRSDDSGNRWRLVAGRAALMGENVRAVTVAPGQPNTVFAVGLGAPLKSADGGRTWVRLAVPPKKQVRAVVALAARNELLAGTNSGLYRSTDGGAIWKPASLGPADPPNESVQWLQSSGGNIIGAATDKGAYLSFDGGKSWNACGAPVQGAQWYGLAASQGATAVALAATSHGIFRSIDRCSTWSPAPTGAGGTAPVVVPHPTRTGEFLAVQNGHVWVSKDDGQSWEAVTDDGPDVSYPSALVVLPAAPDQLFVLLTRRGVFRTTPVELGASTSTPATSPAARNENVERRTR